MFVLSTPTDRLVVLALAVLMAATRVHHFGVGAIAPDASMAAFLLAGLLLGSQNWLLALWPRRRRLRPLRHQDDRRGGGVRHHRLRLDVPGLRHAVARRPLPAPGAGARLRAPGRSSPWRRSRAPPASSCSPTSATTSAQASPTRWVRRNTGTRVVRYFPILSDGDARLWRRRHRALWRFVPLAAGARLRARAGAG